MKRVAVVTVKELKVQVANVAELHGFKRCYVQFAGRPAGVLELHDEDLAEFIEGLKEGFREVEIRKSKSVAEGTEPPW